MSRTNNLTLFRRMLHNHMTSGLSYHKPTIPFKQSDKLAGFHSAKVINLLPILKNYYSVLKDRIGFISAAFTAWKLMVATAITIAPAAETTNTAGLIEI